MNQRYEYIRESGIALANELLELAAKGMFAPRVEELMCQAAGYIIANEGVLEEINERVYRIEEAMAIQMEDEPGGDAGFEVEDITPQPPLLSGEGENEEEGGAAE